MKKILLSLFAVFAALSLSAETKDLDMSLFGDAYNSETQVVSTAGGWDWKGATIGDANTGEFYDASAYEYLIIEAASCSNEVAVIIQYDKTGEEGKWGPIFYESNTVIAPVSKPFATAVKLSDHSAKTSQVAFQDHGNAASLAGVKMYFGSTADYEAAQAKYVIAYEAPKALTIDEGNILATEFDGFSMDAKVEFVYTVDGDITKYNNWGAGTISSLDSKTKVYECPVQGIGDNTVTCYLSDLVEALNAKCEWDTSYAYGLYWNMWGFDGCTCTIKSASISEQVGSTSEKFVGKAVTPKNPPLYVIGNVNGGGWTTDKACAELTYANGVYTGSFTVNDAYEGNGWFAIGETLTETAEDWATFNGGRYSVVADWGTLDEAGDLMKAVDASFKLPAGAYTVTVDLVNETIVIKAADTTGISSAKAASAKSGKYIQNGKVVIYNKGVKYNVAGSIVK